MTRLQIASSLFMAYLILFTGEDIIRVQALECCSDTQVECTPGGYSEGSCNQKCVDMCGAIEGKCRIDGGVQYCHCICN
ncbi:hypothetical protein ACET3Z_025789 [Daucus carota]